MAIELVIAGVAWLLTQSQLLSHIAQRLLDRVMPLQRGVLPQVVVPLQHPADPPPVAGAPPEPPAVAGSLASRLIVPPPARLLFVRDDPALFRPVIAVVLAGGPAGAGQVLWLLATFDVPVELDLPPNAVAMLPATLQVDPAGRGRLAFGEVQYTGTVDGYQVYLSS